MSKNKKSSPKKPVEVPGDQEEVLTRNLASLAVDVAGLQHSVSMKDALKQKKLDLQKLIRKCLQQKKDEVLHEALERAHEDDSDAYQLLRESIEESSEVVVFHRDDGTALEVNAFVIPLFAHTNGGLRSEQCFQDEEAFDLLRKSIQESQLESRGANVVLVAHAYHLDEIEGIGYSQLNEMVREASETMTRKKMTATPAIERSMSGWPESHFTPADRAVELRFLLGFALKRMDDPFYHVPEKEAAADRYFDARAKRFQQWTQQVAPLLKRCLVTDGREVDIDFLYQDLYYGGTARGIAEYDMLQMMSELHHALQLHDIPAAETRAVIGPTDTEGEVALRVNLYAKADGALVASSDKPLGAGSELQDEADDVYDALMTIGVKSLSLAMKFDADGNAVNVRPYTLRA